MHKLPWIGALCAALTSCATPAPGPSSADISPPRGDLQTEPPAPKDAPMRVADPQPVPWKSAPVVVELFSSEGCSSCPPADIVLRDLADQQPVDGAEIIALEMHVDYWNDLGWADPFSSSAFTSRQRAYSFALGDRSVYTPEMVVDGRVGFVGSQSRTARDAVARAAKTPKARVELRREGDALSINVSDMPAASPAADVLLALAEKGLSSDVPRGENAGSVLVHGPVVRSLKKIGAISPNMKGIAFEGSETVSVPAAWRRDRLRAVIIVQAKESMAILGAASAPLG